ncbi:MAG: GntP family permease [Firmicutes bacterium]|jgi:H+/gluconate symporter-like permease|nr:GntP family permease [Bacillota bacterium]
MQIAIMPIALILFGVLAFQKWSALILGPLLSLLVALVAGLPLFETMLGPYMQTAAAYVKNYFLIFLVGAVFGQIMQETGAAESISRALAGITKGKYAAPIVMIITGILTYGGISGFVVFFAMYPIALQLFKTANLPRRLIPAAISAGCWTWSMNSPGTPAIQNIIPMRELGTSSIADPIGGAIAGLIQLVLIFIYLEWQGRRYVAQGITFEDDKETLNLMNRKDIPLPNPWLSILPCILILFLFNVIRVNVESAVLAGIVMAIILLRPFGGNYGSWIALLNRGALNSAPAILNTAIVVGFAGVIRETSGFNQLIEMLKSLQMSPLLFVGITTAIAAGAAGSASGGLGVAFAALKDTYINMGVNLEWAHRIAVIGAGTLDSLPHQGAQITLLAITKQTHKEAYWPIAVTQLIIPFIAMFILIALHSIGLP